MAFCSPFNSRAQEVQTIDPRSLLRIRQVLALIPVSASCWWNGVRVGRFPQPVRLGKRTTLWRASDIFALIESASRETNQGDAS